MDDLSKGSCGKEKLKRMRGCLKSKAKPSANLAKSSMDMESTCSKELLSGSSRREKLKPIRSRLNTTHRAVKPSNKVAESTMDMDSMSLKDMLSGSSRREKLKPTKSRLNTTHREVKPSNKVAGSTMDMDSMSLKDMLRFLDEEEVLLTQLQSKMSEELSRLQVEEHVFLRTLKIYDDKNEGPSDEGNENQQQSLSEDQELIDALNLALKDSGEAVPDNKDPSEATGT